MGIDGKRALRILFGFIFVSLAGYTAQLGKLAPDAPAQPLSIEAGLALIAESASNAVVVLWDAIVHAMIGWLAIGPITIYVLYRALVPLLERAARQLRAPVPAA